MKNKLFKKAVAVTMSLTMVLGMANVVSAAHAGNGANVATGKWEAFSVCTREDGGKWEDALKKVPVNDPDTGEFLRYQTKGQDYATEGFIAAGTTSSNLNFWCVNTGWDAEYNEKTGERIGDNPWGMTATMSNIPAEKGRYYTMSFKVKSGLIAENKNETTGETTKITTKQILVKVYKQGGGDPAIDLLDATGMSDTGYMVLDSTNANYTNVTATFKVPDDYDSNYMGVKFALGAFLDSRSTEIALSGMVNVKDFKITAGNQHTVTFENGSQKVYKYVNNGGKVSALTFTKKGYTLDGFINKATGKKYNFASAVTGNLVLKANFVKTKKPGKAKIKVKSPSRKKVKVTISKLKGAAGFQIQYSAKKNMKKVKSKTTSKQTYTIKGLKSGAYTYVRVRAYAKDSTGKKVYSKKFSSKKKIYVK